MKYMGSKGRLVKELLPILLKGRKEGQYYVEPFAGGMNVICEVSPPCIGNDSNKYLIAMWKELQQGWIPTEVSKEEYQSVRKNINNYPDYYVGWVGFNCSYSGKWFSGYAGKVTTKINTIRDYQAEALRNILIQVPKMKGIELYNRNYLDLVIPKNSIIYCDPPYKETTKYKDDFDHAVFFNWCREKVKEGHTVFVSEYTAPDDFVCIWEKKVKSSLSANGKIGGSKDSIEKLFCNEKNIVWPTTIF